MHAPLFVGIDVSQARLDVALRPGTAQTLSHDDAAIATLVDQLRVRHPTLIVLEATGGLEIPLTSALATAGLPVVVVNPRQVRDFAKASGQLAKTDTLDAQVLAQFAEVMRPQPRPLPDADTRALAAWPDGGNSWKCWEPRRAGCSVRRPPSARACAPILHGSNASWSTQTAGWPTRFDRVPCGARRRSCCGACRAWAPC